MHTLPPAKGQKLTTEQILAARENIIKTEKPAQQRRAQLAADANAVPMPGELPKAFPIVPRVVCGFTLKPLTLGHTQILQEIKSPLLKVMAVQIRFAAESREIEKSKPHRKAPVAELKAWEKRKADHEKALAAELEKIEHTDADTAQMLYIFSREPEETRALLAEGDLDAWKQRAAWREKGIDEAQFEPMHRSHVLKYFREHACKTVIDRLPSVAQFELGRQLAQHYGECFATAIAYDAPRSDGEVFSQPPAGPMTA